MKWLYKKQQKKKKMLKKNWMRVKPSESDSIWIFLENLT